MLIEVVLTPRPGQPITVLISGESLTVESALTVVREVLVHAETPTLGVGELIAAFWLDGNNPSVSTLTTSWGGNRIIAEYRGHWEFKS